MSSDQTRLDPQVQKSINNDLTPQEKIAGLKKIIKAAKSGMLTTRSADGSLHSRLMAPCQPASETELRLTFIGNNASHKFDEIMNDSNVNVSFVDSSTMDWVSYSGKAKVSRDQELIDKYWSTTMSAYFGDLGDGVHKGTKEDPRVSVIQVIPNEIHYWVQTQSSITHGVNLVVGAVTGKASAPGETRILTSAEIQLAEGLHTK